MEESELTKKEKIRLKHELEKKQRDDAKRNGKRGRYAVFGIVAAIILAFLGWLVFASTRPQPGRAFPDEGRDHVKIGAKVTYKTNPPTSGSHYEEWEKSGIYDTPLLDEKLVHSLEHGYIIMSYNCTRIRNPFDFAQGKQESGIREATSSSNIANATQSSSSAVIEQNKVATDTAKWKESSSCAQLSQSLADVATKNRLWKMIVVPRPTMDFPIALTAWGRMDTMERLDEERITAFINAFRDHGPEQTME